MSTKTKERVSTTEADKIEEDKRIQSGWMNKARTGMWIGCGSPDELHEVWVTMQDDAVQDNEPFPGYLVMTPATLKEVERFGCEAGDPWPDLVVQIGKWHYYKSDVPDQSGE